MKVYGKFSERFSPRVRAPVGAYSVNSSLVDVDDFKAHLLGERELARVCELQIMER